MALTTQVNGEARIQVGTGTSYAFEDLGVSIDGVEIDFKLHTEDIRVDTYGPAVAWDTQYFLEDATIRIRMQVFDPAIFAKVSNRGLGFTNGTFAAAGTMMIAQQHTFPVRIKSTPTGTGILGSAPCHTFYNCYVVDSYTKKVGTVATMLSLTFRAMAQQQLSSSAGAILWDTTCS